MKLGFVSLLVILGFFATVVVFVLSYLLFSRSPIEVAKGKLNSKEVLWSSDSRKYSQLSVSDDTLYALSSDGYISAIDPSSGRENWNTKIQGSIGHNFYLYKDYIYYVSLLESNPNPSSPRVLFAINNKTGEEVWSNQIQSYVTTLNISDDILYYTLPKEKKLFAVNSNTGNSLWNFDLDMASNRPESSDGVTVIGAPYSSGKTGNLYGLDSTTGNILWTVPVAIDSTVGTEILIDKGSIYLETSDYFSGYENDNLYALDLKTGKEKWKVAAKGHSEGHSGESLSISNGKVFIAQHNCYVCYVYAFDETTGSEHWKIKTKSGQKYIKNSSSALYLVNNQYGGELAPYYGNLSNIDLKTGKINWEFEKNKTTFSSLMYLDDTVFVISMADGKIYALR